MNNLALSENTPVASVVYTLEGYDPEGGAVRFGLLGTDNFAVQPVTGAVTVIKALDREVSEKQRTRADNPHSHEYNIVSQQLYAKMHATL